MGKEDINRVPRALTNSLNSKLMDQLYDLIPGTNVVVDLIVYLSRHQIGDLLLLTIRKVAFSSSYSSFSQSSEIIYTNSLICIY